MERKRKVALLAFSCLLLGLTTMSFAADPVWLVVEGAQLQTLFVDKELGDNAHFSYRFRRDGTFSGDEMGKDVLGKWRTTSRHLCWSWIKPRGSEECYEVHRSGVDVRLFRHGYETLSGRLAPLETNVQQEGGK